MAKRRDSEAKSVQTAAQSALFSVDAATDAPLTVETPKLEVAGEAPRIEKIELPKIELPNVDLPKREFSKAELPKTDTFAAAAEPAPKVLAAEAPRTPLHRFALAASLACAAVLGALAGAAATAALQPAAPISSGTDDSRALREAVVRLSSEVTALKAGIETTNRNTAGQLAKLADRFDRAEKAQAEPAARLAKVAETLDRLERRPAAAPPVVAAPEVTGSTTVEKQQGKPPVAEGWRLREFHAGRALVESRSGELYDVGPGSNLPGLGKVETIKREDGRVVVVTPKGIIVSSLDQPRRSPYFYPAFRY